VTTLSWFFAVVAGAMALLQLTLRDVAKKRDTEIGKATADHFRFAGLAYGGTAVLAVIAAITSSSIALDLAIVGLITAVGSRTVFSSRRREMIRRNRAKRSPPD
jgi:hypothetical protein